MDLNINSPAYYTKEYGVDDDIYWMCRELSNYVREKKYSDAINIIGNRCTGSCFGKRAL